MTYEDFINKYNSRVFDSKNRINSSTIRTINNEKNHELKADIFKVTEFLTPAVGIKDRLLLIKWNISHWPKCECCDALTKIKPTGKFTTFCSAKCSRQPGSSTFTKAQKTCLERYGAKSFLATPQGLATKIASGGVGLSNPKTRAKVIATNLEKYGVGNVFQSAEIKEKIKDTHDTKFGGNFHTMKLGRKFSPCPNVVFMNAAGSYIPDNKNPA